MSAVLTKLMCTLNSPTLFKTHPWSLSPGKHMKWLKRKVGSVRNPTISSQWDARYLNRSLRLGRATPSKKFHPRLINRFTTRNQGQHTSNQASHFQYPAQHKEWFPDPLIWCRRISCISGNRYRNRWWRSVWRLISRCCSTRRNHSWVFSKT